MDAFMVDQDPIIAIGGVFEEDKWKNGNRLCFSHGKELGPKLTYNYFTFHLKFKITKSALTLYQSWFF